MVESPGVTLKAYRFEAGLKVKLNVGKLRGEAGRAGWLAVACFWVTTLAMAAVFVAGGKILDGYGAVLGDLFQIDSVSNAAESACDHAGLGGAGGAGDAVGNVGGGFMSRLPDASLWWWIVAGVGILIVFAGKFAEIHLEATAQIKGENQWRNRVVSKTFDCGPARIKREQLGSMVSLATESAERMTLYTHSFQPQVKGSFSAPIILILAMGIFVHPLLAGLVLACLPLIPLGIVGFVRFFRKVSSGSSRARSSLAAAYLDALGGLTTLQLLGAGPRVADTLEAVGEQNRQATMRLLRSNQLVILVLDAVFSLFTVTVTAALLVHFAWRGDITPGQALTGLGLALLLLEPIDHFGAFFYIAMAGRGAQRRIRAFLAGGNPEPGGAPASTFGTEARGVGTPAEPGVVELSQVGFGYGGKPVFSDLNLRIYSGERVAIVGASGQGKTTLLNLMKGFLRPQSGRILVNGQAADLTTQSALVSQNTWLFTGTVRENLVAVAPGEPPSEDELWDALEKAHINQEIREMPLGLDTPLGENGTGLSSGQKQRLSLARALISGRKILLLDEVTSQVDLESEREILAALRGLGREYTLIMVTHRSRVTELAQRVLHVAAGEVTE